MLFQYHKRFNAFGSSISRGEATPEGVGVAPALRWVRLPLAWMALSNGVVSNVTGAQLF